jgi:putative cardiolipin synthase
MNPHASAFAGAIVALRRKAALTALLALALLAGCAMLPADVQRPASAALADVSRTALADIAQASTPQDKRGLSGFRLLPDGAEALAARQALLHLAQKSLDVQYYLIAADDTGRQFLRGLRDAAQRGVRVRLLVDDLHADARDELFAALAAHPNVQVRLFNPLPVRSGSRTTRVLFSLHDFDRINRRMHNKLFIADNTFAVTGGRNVADEYFMRGSAANFIDMDVLSAGPVVRELSSVFDSFWNSELAFPIGALGAPDLAPSAAWDHFDALVGSAGAAHPGTATRIDEQLKTGRLDLMFAAVQVFADVPAKAAGAGVGDAAGSAPGPMGAAMQGTLALLRSARSEVLIASPYFIPGQRGLALMREARADGVRISVLTNSLAATDEPLAHWGYARYRKAMLKMGVDLSELSPTRIRQAGMLGNFSSSLGRLHAKLAVVDRRWLMVGSMNMDLRSSRSNTELGLAIDSPELAAEAASLLEQRWVSSNYRLRIGNGSERIEWIAAEDDGDVVHAAEPHTDWLLRLRLGLLSIFVSEDLL